MKERQRVIIDTCVFINALQGKDVEAKVVKDALRSCDICQSDDTFDELEFMLTRSKLSQYLDAAKVQDVLDVIKNKAVFVNPDIEFEASADPEDDMFFDLYAAADADVIVSNDNKGVLDIAVYDGRFRIATPERFLKDAGLSFNTQSPMPHDYSEDYKEGDVELPSMGV